MRNREGAPRAKNIQNPERGSAEKILEETHEEDRRIKEDLIPEERELYQETEKKLETVAERIKQVRWFEANLRVIRGFTYTGEEYIPPEIRNAIDKKKAELQEEFDQLAEKFATIRDPKSKEKIDSVRKEIENI